MTISPPIGALLWGMAIAVCASAGHACEPPGIIAPGENAVVRTPQPVLAWLSPGSDATHDIEIIARVPEGEIMHRVQRTVAGRKWQPDAPLATRDAVVSVRVTQRCPRGGKASAERTFHLTLAGACPLPLRVSSAKIGTRLKVEWEKSAPITGLELRNFFGAAPSPGTLVTTEQSPGWVLLSGDPREVVGVRALCATGVSEWSWLAVAAP